MKNSSKRNLQAPVSGQLPVSCELLLSCLIGCGGRAAMPDFYRIWQQMLPESQLALPELPAAMAASSNAKRLAKSKLTCIREAPD